MTTTEKPPEATDERSPRWHGFSLRRGSVRADGKRRFSLAWRRQKLWVEMLTILLGYGVYEIIQGAASSRLHLAYANGRKVLDLQNELHINIDLAINRFANSHDFLALSAGYYYDTLHYLITPSVLLWVWFYRSEVYARWRSALIGASMAGLVVFWVLPVAPPRFVVSQTVDTLVVHHIFGTQASDGTGTLVNECAAMPSLHCGWAFWCAITIIGTTTTRWRFLALIYPAATTYVVLGTGNHYILDAVGGVAIVSLGLALTTFSPESVRVPWARFDRRAKRSAPQAPSTTAPTGISAK